MKWDLCPGVNGEENEQKEQNAGHDIKQGGDNIDTGGFLLKKRVFVLVVVGKLVNAVDQNDGGQDAESEVEFVHKDIIT